jgi:tRNA threonylcarbamoyladenosine biosynthesis protein TsaB
MKILAFDTSTEIMSIAVQHGTDVFTFTGTGGAQASSRLIPEIQTLMQAAGLTYKELDAIAFGAGPGAFTGLRASCAVAQGLGFAAGVPLCPINTLHAVALARHLQRQGASHSDNIDHQGNIDRSDNTSTATHAGHMRITAALDARMGEVYWQRFDFDNDPLGIPVEPEPQLSKADVQAEGIRFEFGTLPTASILLALAGTMLANGLAVRPADALPLYVRNKVADTTAEREMIKIKAQKAAAERHE